VQELQKPGRTEPKSWEADDNVAIIVDTKKEAGVKRVHPGVVIGKRGERTYVIALHNGDIEVVHETNIHDCPPSELVLTDKNHIEINVNNGKDVEDAAEAHAQNLGGSDSPDPDTDEAVTNGATNPLGSVAGGSSSSSSSSSAAVPNAAPAGAKPKQAKEPAKSKERK
jgi:hypothetical protein